MKGNTARPALKTLRLGFSSHWVPSKATFLHGSDSKMASKTLIRAGASLIKGLSNRSLLHQNTTPNHRILLSGSVGVTPKLFPSLAKPQPSLHLHETLDSQILKELAFDSQALFYPCGLPSLRFFLPDGTLSLYSDEFYLNLYFGLCMRIGMNKWGLWDLLINNLGYEFCVLGCLVAGKNWGKGRKVDVVSCMMRVLGNHNSSGIFVLLRVLIGMGWITRVYGNC